MTPLPFCLMSSTSALPARPRTFSGKKNIAIVASLYNQEFVDAMLHAAQLELQTVMPNATVRVFRVPGAFEVPVTTAYVLEHTEASAVICLGVILQGETKHAHLVAQSVTESLQSLAIFHQTPIIHEVLLLETREQAYERTAGSRINRGVEAARAAANMIELFQKLHAAFPNPQPNFQHA
jgi:6,7-dimethyl-8-ribityllumazine synthase